MPSDRRPTSRRSDGQDRSRLRPRVVGTFGLTIARNVPLYNALAPLDPVAPASAAAWTAYLATWTAWNHARAVAARAGALALTVALIARAAQ